METEINIESFTEGGSPLFIDVKINIYKDETSETIKPSQSFWTYEILKIKACYKSNYETHDFNEDNLNSDHWDEIYSECEKELNSFTRAA